MMIILLHEAEGIQSMMMEIKLLNVNYTSAIILSFDTC